MTALSTDYAGKEHGGTDLTDKEWVGKGIGSSLDVSFIDGSEDRCHE